MKPIWTKDTKEPHEFQECTEWICRIAEQNLVDIDVFGYPSTRTIRAYQKDEAGYKSTMYVPVQRPFMLESLAPMPDTEGTMEAASLNAVMGNVIAQAHREGVGEIYFLCKDTNVISFAERKGFELITIPLLRMKI